MFGKIKDELNARGEEEPTDRFASIYHAPVLCHTVVKQLITAENGIYVDGTLGGAGHAAALLESLDTDARVIGIDQDEAAIEEAENRLADEIESGRFITCRGNFGDVADLLKNKGITAIDGLLLDLGVSSYQLDTPDRGFSHRFDAPLDMRMDSSSEMSAGVILNEWSEAELVTVLRKYGEEPRAKLIARRIVSNRPLESTGQLADLVRASAKRTQESKTLSRTFQAIRMAVNEELDVLESVLVGAVDLIKEGGRMAVISYHSLEDRRVKRFFRSGNFDGEVERDLYGHKICPWKEITKRPIYPTEEEIQTNPRSRSARLRVAERIAERRAEHPAGRGSEFST